MIRSQRRWRAASKALQPFGASVDINQPYALSAPFRGHLNPFPFVFNPSDPNFVFPITVPKGFATGLRNPYMQTFNLTVQQQVTDNLMVEIAYVGNVGRNLTYNREQNRAVYDEGATAGNTDARRIHQGFGSIGQLNSGASSVYNSLQLQVQRRFSRGLTFQVAYTYGRAIDEVLTSSAFATVTQNGLQDPNNRAPERGRGDFDIQQRLVSSILFEIPGPKGGVARGILGGWELGSIFTVQEGRPFHVDAGRDRSLTAVRHDRAQIVGNPHLASDRTRGEKIFEWFDKEAFALAPVGSYGNSGRNNLQGPGSIGLDISLRKRFRITEGHSVDFRVDFFNLPNHPNFGTPRRGSATDRRLGRITGAGSGRIGQFSLKYAF